MGFDGICVFSYHSGLYTMQEPSYLGKIAPDIIMVLNGIDPNTNSGIQRFSHLDIPTKYQYLTGITILIPTGTFIDSNLDVNY